MRSYVFGFIWELIELIESSDIQMDGRRVDRSRRCRSRPVENGCTEYSLLLHPARVLYRALADARKQ